MANVLNISLLVCGFNLPQHLLALLPSVAAQAGVDVELVAKPGLLRFHQITLVPALVLIFITLNLVFQLPGR